MNSLKNVYYKSCATLTVLTLLSAPVIADDTYGKGIGIGKVASNLASNLKSVSKVIQVVCYLAGLSFGIAGLLKLKEYMDKPGQVTLKEPAGRLLVAAMLLALPTLLSVITSSSTGSGVNLDLGDVKIN